MSQPSATLNASGPLGFQVGDVGKGPLSGGRTAPSIDELLLRMQGGSRDAAAEFLQRYASRIRRRIRGKLGPDVRRLFDSLDIISTLGRRLDLYVMSGQLNVATEAQLWGLLFKMADNAVIDKARVYRRLQAVEGEDSEFARQLMNRLRQAEIEQSAGVEIEIEKCLQAIRNTADRRILSLWLSGETHLAIARLVDLAPALVRKRWQKIKADLRNAVSPAV